MMYNLLHCGLIYQLNFKQKVLKHMECNL